MTLRLSGVDVVVDDRGVVRMSEIDYADVIRLENEGFLYRVEGFASNYGHDKWVVVDIDKKKEQ